MFKILDDITLINANSVNPNLSVDVLNFCSKLLKFNKTLLFSEKKPENITPNIEHIVFPINSISEYNKFILKHLNDYINTTHCLVIQNDGFIINPHLWDDSFLNYDYIGAPWNLNGMRVWKRTNRIGNGGFSLRSKKLLSYTQTLNNIDYNQPEDVTNSLIIEKYKQFKYPDVGIAVKFSLEDPLEDFPYDFNTCFGFHGKFIYNNLLNLCPNVLNIKKL